MSVLHRFILAICLRPNLAGLLEFVYDSDYSQLGELVSDLHPIFESEESLFKQSVSYNGHNGFEEIVIDIITYQLKRVGLYDKEPDMFEHELFESWCDAKDQHKWLLEYLDANN